MRQSPQQIIYSLFISYTGLFFCFSELFLSFLSKGTRLKEATKINLSLSALGNVISALVGIFEKRWLQFLLEANL